jgi:hypothetical protein
MRFVFAASVLGWTLPLAHESQAFREEIWEWTTDQERNRKGTRIRAKHQTIRERVLRNTPTLIQHSHHRQNIVEQKECDPTSVDPDIGILSCGFNQYCVTSERSILGGQCIPAVSNDHLLRRRVEEEDDDHSSVNETNQNVFEYLLMDCELPYCNCSNVNETAYTLHQRCYYEEQCDSYLSRCGVNNTFCFTHLWEGDLKPFTIDISRCWEATGGGFRRGG